MKGVRKASRVQSTESWYSNGAKNLFGLDGAWTEHLALWMGIHIASENTGTMT